MNELIEITESILVIIGILHIYLALYVIDYIKLTWRLKKKDGKDNR